MSNLTTLYVPYVIIGIIWLAMALLSILLYYLFLPENWERMYQQCTAATYNYLYVIRFIFGSHKRGFIMSTTTITIDILDSNQSICVIELPSKKLEQNIRHNETSKLNVFHILLYRKCPLKNIKNVVVNHNGESTINVNIIEIQDINSPEANIAYVGQAIKQVKKESALYTQIFPAATREQRKLEPELSSVTLSRLDFMVLFFVAINQILLQTIFVIPCSDGLCHDFAYGLLPSLYAALVATASSAFIFACLCLIYRFIIIQLSIIHWISCWLQYMFIALLVCNGVAMGATAAYLSSDENKFVDHNNQKYVHQVYWLLSVAMAMAMLFFICIPVLSVIGQLIGFFTESLPLRFNKDNDKSDEIDYKTQMYRNNIRFNSISEYLSSPSSSSSSSPSASTVLVPPPLAQKPSINSQKQSLVKSDNKKSDTLSTSMSTPSPQSKADPNDEDIGEDYYKELMTNSIRVKSVSQYTGISKT